MFLRWGDIMTKKLGFWKTHWGRHFRNGLIAYFCLCVFFAFLIIFLFGVPLEITLLLSIPWIYIYLFPIIAGVTIAIFMSKSVKPLFIILELNNCSYTDKIPKTIIPKISITLPVYLMIFFVYLFSLGKYDPNLTLLLSWIMLIIVRSSYYANKKLGNQIGSFIGSFFLPFGFLTMVLFIKDFLSNVPTDPIPIVIFLSYFVLIVIGQLPLEALMDYITSEDRRIEKIKE